MPWETGTFRVWVEDKELAKETWKRSSKCRRLAINVTLRSEENILKRNS